jgi:hypothetical protein
MHPHGNALAHQSCRPQPLLNPPPPFHRARGGGVDPKQCRAQQQAEVDKCPHETKMPHGISTWRGLHLNTLAPLEHYPHFKPPQTLAGRTVAEDDVGLVADRRDGGVGDGAHLI